MHFFSRNLATITFAIATYACVVSPVRARLSRRNRRWELSPVHRSVATSLVEDREDSSQGNGTKYVFMHHVCATTTCTILTPGPDLFSLPDTQIVGSTWSLTYVARFCSQNSTFTFNNSGYRHVRHIF